MEPVKPNDNNMTDTGAQNSARYMGRPNQTARVIQLVARRDAEKPHVPSTSNATAPGRYPANAIIAQIEAIVQKNIDCHLSVKEICSELGMSRSAVHKHLKKHTGYALTYIVNRIRVRRACTLLLNEQLTISEIAYDVGFTDPAYFTRIFKRLIGVCPRHYRKCQLSGQGRSIPYRI